jgi:class 3 adenylate cyclase/tetratricopeptide (TPR) repeat protein
VKRCPNCGEENVERARFCQACGTALDTEPAAQREVRKVVTVLFTDVTGSTSLGERLDPESLRRVMGRFFDAMKAAIERHGGVVEKFIGDAVMAVFGIPRLHEDDPIRAVRASAAMAEELERLNAELQAERGVTLIIRTGITTGEVVAGDPAAGQRLVTGDTVNTAARLEQAAKPGEVLIGEPTYRLVRDAVRVEPVDPLELKGKAEPVPAYRLLGVEAGAEAHARRLDSPMVGRDRELRLLGEALDRAVSERTSHLFTLLGPAGVGKSRLVLEFIERVSNESSVIRGRCLSYGDGITFFPVAEAVRDAAGIDDNDSMDEARQKLERVAAATDQPALVATTVAELIGLAESPVAAEDAFWAVRGFFESLARDRPLVVVFDDIHWAEPAFLDLVEHIADWTRDAAILLLCVARPELLDVRPGWGGGKLNAQSILLEPLGSDQCAELLDNLLGAEGLPADARARILEAAEGNPLFVEEMIGMLIDDGLLRREDGRWVSSDEVARVAVPPTIQLLLAARLDRLDAEERAVAERASVEGKIFHRGAVVRLSPDGDRPQVRTRLLALARKELIRPDRATFAGEDAFRFRHLLIRDAAYHGMPKEARAELHLAFADWLSEQAGDRLAEYEDILGYHLEQAYRYRLELGPVDEANAEVASRAAAALASAGRRAAARDDHHAAVGLLRRALDLMPEEALELPELRYELAEELTEVSDFREAEELAREVIRDARAAGDRRVEALASQLEAWLINTLDPTTSGQAVRDQAAEAMRTLEELGDVRGAIRALETVGFMTFVLGQVDEALDIARARLDRARRIADARAIRGAVQGLTGCLYYGSVPASRAIEEIEELASLVAESPTALAEAQRQQAGLYAMLGRFDEARQAADRTTTLMKQVGARFRLAGLAFWIGPMHMLAKEYEEAERTLRESIGIFEEIGDKGFLSTLAVDLAEALIAQGRFDEAEPWAERGRQLGAEDDAVTQMGWRAARASILAHQGRLDEAEGLAREALDVAASTDYVDMRGDLWLRLGEVLRQAGNTNEAADAIREAIGLYDRKENLVMAAQAREELASLATTS